MPACRSASPCGGATRDPVCLQRRRENHPPPTPPPHYVIDVKDWCDVEGLPACIRSQATFYTRESPPSTLSAFTRHVLRPSPPHTPLHYTTSMILKHVYATHASRTPSQLVVKEDSTDPLPADSDKSIRTIPALLVSGRSHSHLYEQAAPQRPQVRVRGILTRRESPRVLPPAPALQLGL